MDLRKERRGYDTEESAAPRSAYTILPNAKRSGLVVCPSSALRRLRKRKKPGDIDVALDVDSLHQNDGISKDDLRRKFEDGKKEEGIGAKWAYDDDLSEMIAQESRKRQKTEAERNDKRREGRNRY
ncbi:hypothetical protein NM208_g11720 [Fusarium decemcellulare]|uniref:Uncharacterized protein n=1 Tax=Fusarium decemcellulare TaxID=57161 RepID=A0ACC1RTC0_9HYPO|nr:hypothetical protein NM208_g11720 [Fusarium decemcellulare]